VTYRLARHARATEHDIQMPAGLTDVVASGGGSGPSVARSRDGALTIAGTRATSIAPARQERPTTRDPRPTTRDALFRRLLAVADLAAAAGGLGVLGALGSGGIAPIELATIPLIVVIAKMTGRYDHDEVVLRKSTLDGSRPC
jgi:hypothetical protein